MAASGVEAAATGAHARQAPPAALELIEDVGWLVRLRWLAIVGVLAAAIGTRAALGVRLPLSPIALVLGLLAVYNLLLTLELGRVERERSGEDRPRTRGERLRRAVVLAPAVVARSCVLLVAASRRLAGNGRPRPTLARLLVPSALAAVDGRWRIPETAALASAQICFDLLSLAALLHLTGGVDNPFAYFLIFHVIVSAMLLRRRATFLHTTFGFALVAGVALGEWSGLLPHVPIGLTGWPEGYRTLPFVLAHLAALFVTLYLAAFLGGHIASRLRARQREAAALAAEVEAGFARLAEIERLKSSYMRKVSHELRGPLATIQTALRVVIDGLGGQLPYSSSDLIVRAERRTGELIGVTADLLVLSRAREAPLAADMVAVDPAAVATEALAEAEAAAHAGQLALRAEIGADVGTLRADPAGLKHLLDNLLSNAIRYTRPGGQVVLALAREDGRVRFEVRDTGIGIAAADLRRIFEDFYRASNARALCATGTGLGMSIVKAIVEQHGGTVQIASTPGVGTTVTVVLPASGTPGPDPAVHDAQAAT